MPVREIQGSRRLPRLPRMDIAGCLGRLAVGLAAISFGGVAWFINGGYSVLGLGVMATSFNETGRLFWETTQSITFKLPVSIAGLPQEQPLVPWIGVVATTILQIVVIHKKRHGEYIPRDVLGWTIALSSYDLCTTFFGLYRVEWITQAGPLIQGTIAIILTFCVEITVGCFIPVRRYYYEEHE